MIYNCNKVFDIKGSLVWIAPVLLLGQKTPPTKYKTGYSYEKIIKRIRLHSFYLTGVSIAFDRKSFGFFHEIEKGYNLH